jgi:hypothetical protein
MRYVPGDILFLLVERWKVLWAVLEEVVESKRSKRASGKVSFIVPWSMARIDQECHTRLAELSLSIGEGPRKERSSKNHDAG